MIKKKRSINIFKNENSLHKNNWLKRHIKRSELVTLVYLFVCWGFYVPLENFSLI